MKLLTLARFSDQLANVTSKRTIQRKLKSLVEAGRLAHSGAGPSSNYQLIEPGKTHSAAVGYVRKLL